MKNEEIAKYVKTLQLAPGSILVIDATKVDLRGLRNMQLDVDFRVPILAIYGTPSIECLTREQLAQALRLIDENAGAIPA
jgi:predicted kinase